MKNKKAKKVWLDAKSGKLTREEFGKMLMESTSFMKDLVTVIKEEISSDKECYGKSVNGLEKAIGSLTDIIKSGVLSEKDREIAFAIIQDICNKLAEMQKDRQNKNLINTIAGFVTFFGTLAIITYKNNNSFVTQPSVARGVFSRFGFSDCVK